jgi:nucleotide-binding universal stress UspA family protein
MFRKILVPVDFSDVTDKVLDEARRIARSFNAKTWLVHVAAPEPDFIGYEVGPAYIRDSLARDLRDQHQRLQVYQEMFAAEHLEATSMLVPGIPVRKVVAEAERLAPDLIIIGSHGHGALYHLVMGSVAESVLKHATCPVLVVPCKLSEPTEADIAAGETTTA